MPYEVASRAYVARARRCLDAGTQDALFYAALELRCGVESRMRGYLRTQEIVSEKRKSGWQVAKLARDIETVFRSGDRYVELALFDSETGAPAQSFMYAPVRKPLRDAAERLGDALHAVKVPRGDDDPWWTSTRRWLEQIYADLEAAVSGELMGVPLIDPVTQRVWVHLELIIGPGETRTVQLPQRGGQLVVAIRYHETHPAHGEAA